MLVSVEGVYRNGRIELTESPNNVPEGTYVIVTFVRSQDVDLESRGIDKEQAENLRTHLSTFAKDWESPEMSIYDDYDADKASN